jgi:hypothetical protein
LELEGIIVVVTTKIFYSRQRRAHQEIVELYKQQILSLEIQLEYVKQDRERYEKLLFEQLGLITNRAESTETQQQIRRAMSPLRMKVQLEQASRIAARKE